MTEPVDQEVRDEVLNTEKSFIVQAPAGSGKTSLLVHRVLALLAIAEHPEEVLAITFTRKASAEMRARILTALRGADRPEPSDNYKKQAWRLARLVLGRDQEMGWDILCNPQRLSIQTIDALSSSLVRQMPWLSRTGGQGGVADHPERLYRAAARATIANLSDKDTRWREPISILLAQHDNDSGRVVRLLAAMLQRRDQWLRHIVRDDLEAAREGLESAWEEVVRQDLATLANSVPLQHVDTIVLSAATAAENLLADGRESPIVACAGMETLPGMDADGLVRWQGIREMLLVRTAGKDGRLLRKSVTVTQGMPAGSQEKTELQELLSSLEKNTDWLKHLAEVTSLPAPHYDEDQWRGLLALAQVLKLAVAELQIQFRELGEADFSEVSLRADQALGRMDNPSTLTLRMDYRLQHILVDEFQDTSHAQVSLLEKLVAGWERGDGRTLFIVGDPMQSIYRFREADVGLFLRVIERGIGTVRPEYRVLQCNFRSAEEVVGWCNGVFQEVFPAEGSSQSGAITYSPAVAAGKKEGPGKVGLNAFLSREQEAERVAEIVTETVAAIEETETADTPKEDRKKVAILVRGKAHLEHILPALRNKDISYQGVELEPLANRQGILDILALTRAITQLDHRPAWLAILRAPWCGLTLADLKAVVGTRYSVPVWSRLTDTMVHRALSGDGRARLGRFLDVMTTTMNDRHRVSITENVEWTWRQLGGPDCLTDTALRDAKTCFALLADTERGGGVQGPEDLPELLAQLYAVPDSHDARVQVMTIHKAKGLEFDTVILPGLDRQPRSDDKDAMMWAEVAQDGDEEVDRELLLAPLPGASSENTAQYDYLRRLERQRDQYEQTRLLYVACTRAERHLHLLSTLKVSDQGEIKLPVSSSLLKRLWPHLENEFVRHLSPGEIGLPEEGEIVPARPAISRLPSDYRLQTNKPLNWSAGVTPLLPGERPEFYWAGDMARLVGLWVHDRLNDENGNRVEVTLDDTFRETCRLELAALGVEEAEQAAAVDRASAALKKMQGDPRVDWLFSAGHHAVRAEFDLSHIVDGRIVRIRLDRTFIDEKGVRWIIDFKTGLHQGADVEGFLDSEKERYRPQLEGYAAAVSAMEAGPIRLGLYFPLHRGWREWEYLPAGGNGA